MKLVEFLDLELIKIVDPKVLDLNIDLDQALEGNSLILKPQDQVLMNR